MLYSAIDGVHLNIYPHVTKFLREESSERRTHIRLMIQNFTVDLKI